jgi:hypothetical protein
MIFFYGLQRLTGLFSEPVQRREENQNPKAGLTQRRDGAKKAKSHNLGIGFRSVLTLRRCGVA